MLPSTVAANVHQDYLSGARERSRALGTGSVGHRCAHRGLVGPRLLAYAAIHVFTAVNAIGPTDLDTMPLHPALQHLIDTKLAHTRAPQWQLPIGEVRDSFRALWTPTMTGTPLPVGRVEAITITGSGGEIPARVYAPDRERAYPVIVYLHGGGYVKGGLDESDVFCRNLASVARHLVVAIGYRLAPEHPFPAALDDAISATAWASEHATDIGGVPGALVICGESAGGNLAAVTCLQARSRADILIGTQVLLQPVIDFALTFPSIAMRPDECLVPRDDLAWYYQTYAGRDHDPKDPRLSPLYANDLMGLPRALIITAEYDTLRDEGAAYAERLNAAGVATRCSCYPGMIHGFLQMGGLVDEARSALTEIARAIG
jgi:acetyl esterase